MVESEAPGVSVGMVPVTVTNGSVMVMLVSAVLPVLVTVKL